MVHIDFNKLRFLIIDDNLHMRRILRTLLHGFGARDVIEAEDGAGGLEGFSQRDPTSCFSTGRCRSSMAWSSSR